MLQTLEEVEAWLKSSQAALRSGGGAQLGMNHPIPPFNPERFSLTIQHVSEPPPLHCHPEGRELVLAISGCPTLIQRGLEPMTLEAGMSHIIPCETPHRLTFLGPFVVILSIKELPCTTLWLE